MTYTYEPGVTEEIEEENVKIGDVYKHESSEDYVIVTEITIVSEQYTSNRLEGIVIGNTGDLYIGKRGLVWHHRYDVPYWDFKGNIDILKAINNLINVTRGEE